MDAGMNRSATMGPGHCTAEYEAHEGRVEFFDSRAEIVWMVREPAHAPHERPRNRLAHLLERIAQVRGSAIESLGETEIRRTECGSGEHGSIHPDQMLFLHPDRTGGKISRYLDVGKDPYPDVVVEVDSTTDVRRNRLKLYEECGFPELWVEVPVAYAAGRPAGSGSGMRIYLLEGARYVLSEESRALPGWRAVEIHRALNEPALSEETSAVLSRVGRALGKREGAGPDDDPLLRQQRAQERADLIRALLCHRGVHIPPDFPEGLAGPHLDALRATSAERVVAAASAAVSLADFLARLDESSA
jgi:Uma2 family endonuclease